MNRCQGMALRVKVEGLQVSFGADEFPIARALGAADAGFNSLGGVRFGVEHVYVYASVVDNPPIVCSWKADVEVLPIGVSSKSSAGWSTGIEVPVSLVVRQEIDPGSDPHRVV